MRRFDKKINILKANILAEQRHLVGSGFLHEIEDMDIAYQSLTEADFDVYVEEPEVDNQKDEKKVEKTKASFFQVRFNLAKNGDVETGKNIFMTWKVEPNGKTAYLGDDKLSFNPDQLIDKVSTGGVRNNFNVNEFNLEFVNCSLVNRPSSGYEVKCHANKFPFSYLKCSDVIVNHGGGSGGSLESQIIYNPRVAPYWMMVSSTELFETATNEPIKIGEQKMEIKKYENGVVYESCVSVSKGEDDKNATNKILLYTKW